MTDRSQDTVADAATLTHNVKLLVDLIRSCRVMLVYGEPGARRDHLFRSEIVPQMQAVGPGGRKEVVILFDAWDGRTLPALQAHIQSAVTQTTGNPIPGSSSDQSFASMLRSGQEACNVTFLIIFDHFNKYLTAPAQDDDRREFEDEFVEAANDNALRINFLLVLDHDVEPLLARLRARLPSLGNESIRLPAARVLPKPAVEARPTEALSNEVPAIRQQPVTVPPMTATASKTLARPSFSLRKGGPVPALALVVVVWVVVSAGVSLMRSTPEPAAGLIEARPMPAVGVEKNVSEAPPPEQVSTTEMRLAEAWALSEGKKPATPPNLQEKLPASTAGKAAGSAGSQSALRKPRATPRRPSSAGADLDKREETMVVAIDPRLSVDQAYEQRAGKECKPGLVGVICREKIRYALCAGKWTPEDQPGARRCQVW